MIKTASLFIQCLAIVPEELIEHTRSDQKPDGATRQYADHEVLVGTIKIDQGEDPQEDAGDSKEHKRHVLLATIHDAEQDIANRHTGKVC